MQLQDTYNTKHLSKIQLDRVLTYLRDAGISYTTEPEEETLSFDASELSNKDRAASLIGLLNKGLKENKMKLTTKQRKLVKEYAISLVKGRLVETPDINDMSSGAFGNKRRALDNIDKAKYDQEIITTPKGNFKVTKPIKSISLNAGDLIMATYNSSNQGTGLYEFLGVTSSDSDYGDEYNKHKKIRFKSVRECLKFYKVSSLKALEALQSENKYPNHSYMIVKDLVDGDSGAWFYLYNGRWSRGSGAEALSFSLIQKV